MVGFARLVCQTCGRSFLLAYETNPLVCSSCQGHLKVVSFIEDGQTIRKTLEHLGLWLANVRPQPRAHSPPGLRPFPEDSGQDSYSQLPARDHPQGRGDRIRDQTLRIAFRQHAGDAVEFAPVRSQGPSRRSGWCENRKARSTSRHGTSWSGPWKRPKRRAAPWKG